MHPVELTGLLGWAERVMNAMGEWGVGVLVLLETIFPPLPSEVVLPLAGFLTSQDTMTLPLVIVAATIGAYLGALGLYAVGARLGQERSVRLLSRLPLVDADDFRRAGRWFERHGKVSVFFGRLIPGVRSLISLPAGAHRMPLGQFSLVHPRRERPLERRTGRRWAPPSAPNTRWSSVTHASSTTPCTPRLPVWSSG